jgi:positive regulator of sigma E activity
MSDEDDMRTPNQANVYGQTVELLSPNKMLVESATMIYILSFMIAIFVMLVWKGSSLSSGQVLLGALGLMFTLSIAVRQFASFR